jgi:hypothetical protein
VNAANLTLWKLAGNPIYFQKINSTTWRRIQSNVILATLTVVYSLTFNDTLVLYDGVSTYYGLTSRKYYSSSSLTNLFSTSINDGTWIIVFYSAGIGN